VIQLLLLSTLRESKRPRVVILLHKLIVLIKMHMQYKLIHDGLALNVPDLYSIDAWFEAPLLLALVTS
jgi:hypothetical protein